jgi:hypothetical protein
LRVWITRIAAAALAAGAVLLVVSWLVETDEDRIEALVESMRDAALAGDVDGVIAGLAEDASFGGRDREWIRREVRRTLEGLPPKAIAATLEYLEVEEDRATGRVDVVYRSEKAAQAGLVRLRVTFVKRDDRWLVSAAETR